MVFLLENVRRMNQPAMDKSRKLQEGGEQADRNAENQERDGDDADKEADEKRKYWHGVWRCTCGSSEGIRRVSSLPDLEYCGVHHKSPGGLTTRRVTSATLL